MNWDDFLVDAATDTGMRRSNNQDCHAVVRASSPEAWRQRGHVFMVADGMGAHAVGELASKLACDNIPHNYIKAKNNPPTEAITKSYREVGALIHGKATANREFHGMGTTCSTLLLLPEGALVAHVGDSRVYRTRGGRIDQLSFDHSLVWELVRRNHLTPEQAQRAVPKNVITRSLGPDPSVEVDIEGPVAVETGDVFLLCSDGLSGHLTDHELGIFSEHFHPHDTCRYTLNLANLRGGLDNITVLVVRIGGWVDPESAETMSAGPAPEPARRSGGWKQALTGLFSRRSDAGSGSVEDRPYRTAPCALNDDLIERLDEQIRKTQTIAVEQAWSLDWTVFAEHRRKITESRATGNDRRAVRYLGESIVMLGQAGRMHRKLVGQAPSIR